MRSRSSVRVCCGADEVVKEKERKNVCVCEREREECDGMILMMMSIARAVHGNGGRSAHVA